MPIRKNHPAPSPDKVYSLATETALFLARSLNKVGIKTVVVDQEKAMRLYEEGRGSGVDFSVRDISRLSYRWDGDDVSMAAFADAFSDRIKGKDRTLEDAERIAKEFIEAVKADPEAAGMRMLKAEYMSHANYFHLGDGTVFTEDHPMFNSPEFETQWGLYGIYRSVLGERSHAFFDLLKKQRTVAFTAEERIRFTQMESEVSASYLMQSSLEVPASVINENRVRDIRNLIQYFEGNDDYTMVEKALIVKGAMTWGVREKKDGEVNVVELKRIDNNNTVAVPVIGGEETAGIVEYLRQGFSFKDSLKKVRIEGLKNNSRSVARSFSGWKVYSKSDSEEDAIVLNRDVAGTGWCTGGALSTARSHLSGGDFHVYFENGEPLIAIRTVDGVMAEPPRGAHHGQFCTEREEQIAFDYIKQGNGITAGVDYVADIEDIRRIMSPDATWKDVFFLPLERRYENGEFDGDTHSWGEAVENRVAELLSGVSVDERHREGYYLSEEFLNNYSGNLRFLRGDLDVSNCILNFPQLQSVLGTVHVFEGATFNALQLQSVGRDVLVDVDATFEAPQLHYVRGDVDMGEDATFVAQQLHSVEGYVGVRENVIFNAPQLQSVEGDVLVDVDAIFEASQLHSVGGDVLVDDDATFVAPQLHSVEGYVDVSDNVTFNAPQLQSVGGKVVVRENATFNAPQLQSVVGRVHVFENATFEAPQLQFVGGNVEMGENATFNAPLLQFKLSDGTVYGYQSGDTIYLTPSGINPNTPIHEYAHLWAKVYEKLHPVQWKTLKQELKSTPVWDKVARSADYSFLSGDDNRLAGEVLASIIGDEGERILIECAHEVLKSRSVSFVGDAVGDTVDYFRRKVDSMVVSDVFGLTGFDVCADITLQVLRDFTESKNFRRVEVNEAHRGLSNKKKVENCFKNPTFRKKGIRF